MFVGRVGRVEQVTAVSRAFHPTVDGFGHFFLHIGNRELRPGKVYPALRGLALPRVAVGQDGVCWCSLKMCETTVVRRQQAARYLKSTDEEMMSVMAVGTALAFLPVVVTIQS